MEDFALYLYRHVMIKLAPLLVAAILEIENNCKLYLQLFYIKFIKVIMDSFWQTRFSASPKWIFHTKWKIMMQWLLSLVMPVSHKKHKQCNSVTAMPDTIPVLYPTETPSQGCRIPANMSDMLFEAARLLTFTKYPIDLPLGLASKLAKLGFYYTGIGLQIRCYSCGMTSNDIHEAHNHMCGNASMNSTIDRIIDNIIDMLRIHRPPLPQIGTHSRRMTLARMRALLTTRLEALEGPAEQNRYPLFSGTTRRLASLATWSPRSYFDPLEVANAGFYFTGVDDLIRCFCCGLGLRAWGKGRDIWQLHAHNSPQCRHLRRVDKVTQKGRTSLPNNYQTLPQQVVQETNDSTVATPECATMCPLCYGPISRENGIVLRDCQHVFCRRCLFNAVQDGSSLQCPYPNCGSMLGEEARTILRIVTATNDSHEDRTGRNQEMVTAAVSNRNQLGCERRECFRHRNVPHYDDSSRTEGDMNTSRTSDEETNSVSSSNQNTQVPCFTPNDEVFTCPLCFGRTEIGFGIVLRNCSNAFCRVCFLHFAQTNEDSTLQCPYLSCNSQVHGLDIRAILSAAAMADNVNSDSNQWRIDASAESTGGCPHQREGLGTSEEVSDQATRMHYVDPDDILVDEVRGNGGVSQDPFVNSLVGVMEEEMEEEREKQEELRREKLCKVCYENDKCIVFLNCNHFATCRECSERLTECPVCRSVIQQRMVVYSS